MHLGLVLSQCQCLFHMVKTQISHPTFSPLISAFDWHPFFPLPHLFLMLLAVPVSLCNHQEPATLSMFAAASLNQLSFILPPFLCSLSITGWRAATPYFHKCSKSTKTSCSATYHEGRVVPWSCWKPAGRLGDSTRDPRVVLILLFFLRKCLVSPVLLWRLWKKIFCRDQLFAAVF